MKAFRIALLPGDGIGPEVVAEAVRVLDAVVASAARFSLTYEEMDVGAGAYLRTGDPLPPATFDRLREFDAILVSSQNQTGTAESLH